MMMTLIIVPVVDGLLIQFPAFAATAQKNSYKNVFPITNFVSY
jgi:hypothetical protein